MRKAALILGVLGGLVAGALGMKWLSDFGQLNDMQRAMGGEQLQDMGTAGLLLILSLVLGVTGGIMSWKRKFLVGGGAHVTRGNYSVTLCQAGNPVPVPSYCRRCRSTSCAFQIWCTC